MDTCGIYNNDKEEFPNKTMKEKTDEGDKIIKNLPFASYNERLNSFQNWPNTIITFKRTVV